MIRSISIALQVDSTIVHAAIYTIKHTVSILECRIILYTMINKILVAMDYTRKFLVMTCEEQPHRKPRL